MKGKRRKRKTLNLAYPIIEAKARIEEGLMPWESWGGCYSGLSIPKFLNVRQLNELALEFWDADETETFGDLVYEGLERSAFALGHEWSNEQQKFVPITGEGAFQLNLESGEWEAL